MPTFPPSFLDGAYGFLSDSEYVSKFPPSRELPIEPMVGPSPGEEEFAEHGSIALRIFVDVASDVKDNIIDTSWKLAKGGTVLVRAKAGGFYMVPLQKDDRGWFVTCGKSETKVTLDSKRNCWVVRELL